MHLQGCTACQRGVVVPCTRCALVVAALIVSCCLLLPVRIKPTLRFLEGGPSNICWESHDSQLGAVCRAVTLDAILAASGLGANFPSSSPAQHHLQDSHGVTAKRHSKWY